MKRSLLHRFNEYKKEKSLKDKINCIKVFQLIKIEWVKRDVEDVNYDLIFNTLGWNMKVTGKTGSGKTTFVSAFFEFLL